MIDFGIIGTNWITHSFVAGAHATGKWNLAAVCSRKEESAQEFASQYSDKTITTYTDLSALAASPHISTIYIASPNILHYTHAKQMLSAGKNVILEKPSCSTAAELDDLFRTSKAHNATLIEAFRHLQEPNFQLLKCQLPTLGPLTGASLTYAQFSSRYTHVLDNPSSANPPNTFNLAMGGGALPDLGSYCLSAAIALFGVPTTSTYFPHRIATGADGAGHLILTYDNNPAPFTVHLSHSKIFNSASPSEIYGTDATLIVPSITDIASVVRWDVRTKEKVEVEGVQQVQRLNLQAEAAEFARIIEERDEGARAALEEVSRGVVGVMERVRRENGLLFAGGV